MKEQTRASKGNPNGDHYPTAYELNNAGNDDDRQIESEFIY